MSKTTPVKAGPQSRFYAPMSNAIEWKQFLADEKHWKEGYSAKSLADSWQPSEGFPDTIEAVLAGSEEQSIASLEFLVGFPEFKVDLPGGSRPSQTDLMVLARADEELSVIAVEGKAEESFGPVVSQWRTEASDGKTERLEFLLDQIGLTGTDVDSIRYQLLHRTVSALLTAKHFCSQTAIVLVHTFSPGSAGYSDYEAFLKLFGLTAERNKIQSAGVHQGIKLHFGWVADAHRA